VCGWSTACWPTPLRLCVCWRLRLSGKREPSRRWLTPAGAVTQTLASPLAPSFMSWGLAVLAKEILSCLSESERVPSLRF
jgi:hypothetical protein